MDRITNPGVTPDPREFTEGDPEAGLPATPLAAKWLNDLQEEICAVIEAHTGALDPNNRNQLRDAILYWVDNANAAKVDGLPIVMTDALEGYVLSVIGAGAERQVVAMPAQSATPPDMGDIEGLQEALDGKLNKAGDTATGPIVAPKFTMNDEQGTEDGDAVRYDFLDTQIPKRPGLCSSDLNSHTSAGIFHQSSDSTAENGQNYPAPYKGTLLVFANGGGSMQIYSTWSTMGWQFRRIYYRTQFQGSFSSWLEVYDTGNKPTPDEIGAAPESHTHTAAEVNSDLLSSGFGQVGTYGFMVVTDTNAPPSAGGAIFSGSQLRWANADATVGGGTPSGSWKNLCNVVGGTGIGTVKATGLFVRVL